MQRQANPKIGGVEIIPALAGNDLEVLEFIKTLHASGTLTWPLTAAYARCTYYGLAVFNENKQQTHLWNSETNTWKETS